jgi:CRP-like cAMP-binding protein
MDELFAYLESLSPMSPELRAALVGRFGKESYRKNKVMLRAGDKCDWIGFVERGLIKVCYDVPRGGEHIVSFAQEGEVVFAAGAFTTSAASSVSIVAMDETLIRKVRRVELEAVCERHPAFNVHLRQILEHQSVLIEDHYLLLTLPARERVQRLEREDSWILNDRRIRGYMVANYLGIEQSTYSKFRNGR